MRPLAMSNPVAITALYGGLAVWALLEVRGAQRRATSEQDRGSRRLLTLAAAVGLVAAFALARTVPAAAIPGPRWIPVATGIGLLAAGVALRVWAIRTLGPAFTYSVQVRPGQPIVSTGPYRILRHPAYTGLLLASLGVGVALGNWLSTAAAAVLGLIGLLWRIHVEEQVMQEVLGPDYAAYSAGRRRLVPGLW